MVGPYQLLILAVVSSVVSSADVKTTKYSQPFLLDMPVSQACKEKAQEKCKHACGWAACVPARETTNEDCCPEQNGFICCEMPENGKYTWVKKSAFEMLREFDENYESKWQGYCVCDFSQQERMMTGMCLDIKSEQCECCWTDPIISKLPRLLHLTKESGKCHDGLICVRREGSSTTACCDEDYATTYRDHKFQSYQELQVQWNQFYGLSFGPYSTYAKKYYQYIPRYALTHHSLWREHHQMNIRPFTLDKSLWSEWWAKSMRLIKHSTPEVNEEILDWYWVMAFYLFQLKMTRKLGSTLGSACNERPVCCFNNHSTKKADMVGALDKGQKCKDKPVYCACDPLHFDQIMKGMCCDKSTLCECCQTDPTLSKMEKVLMAQVPKPSPSCKDEIKANFGKKPAFCQWTEGWTDSAKCCDKHYKLVMKDDRYDEQKVSLTPRYAGIEGINRHYPFCRNRLPWIYQGICSFEWYWVPQEIDGHGG